MKKILLLIFLGIFNNSYSQNVKEFSPHYIVGNNVNIRFKPNLDSEVSYRTNWGDKYLAKKINKSWYQILGYEDETLYVFHEYIKQESEFIERARKNKIQNSKTELILFKYYLQKGFEDESINLAIKLINNSQTKVISFGFEKCEFVSDSAYGIYTANLTDDKLKEKIYKRITNRSILRLIELNQIEELIKDAKYKKAKKRLNIILTESCDSLFVPVACEYNLESKDYPQIRFKNLYFINYHLSDFEEKKDMLKFLRARRDNSNKEKCRRMAQDIYSKLSNIWDVN